MRAAKSLRLKTLIINALGFCLSLNASAAFTSGGEREAEACFVMQDLDGDVEIWNGSKTSLRVVRPGEPLLCGDWVSTGKTGYIELKYLQGGARLRLGADTVFEIHAQRGGFLGQLLRGSALVQTQATKAKIMDSRMTSELDAASTVLFTSAESSKSVVIQGKSQFANRYVSNPSREVGFGKYTELDPSEVDVVPYAPKIAHWENVKSNLVAFRTGEKDLERIESLWPKGGEKVDWFHSKALNRRIASVATTATTPVTPSKDFAPVTEIKKAPILKHTKWVKKAHGSRAPANGVEISESSEKKRLLKALSSLTEESNAQSTD